MLPNTAGCPCAGLAAMAKVQEGLGGKARAIAMGVVAAVAVLVAVLIIVPYPLQDGFQGPAAAGRATFRLLPEQARIEEFKVGPGQDVSADDDLA